MNKRKKIIVALIVITVLSVVAFMVYDYFYNDLPVGFTVTAHSGSEGTPDNSMEFLEKCIEINVEVLEIDLTFRKDGTPVVIHTDVAKDGEGLLFDDAIKYISENSDTVRVNLDLKSVANLPAAVEILDKYGMHERCFYTGVEPRFLEAVQKDGGLPYYLNLDLNRVKKSSDKELARALESVQQSGAIGINCSKKYASAKMVTLFHKNGLLVSYWTANSEKDMKKLLAMGPDNITTRYPSQLTELAVKKK